MKRNKGFTLVELMVVVSIIAILAIIGLTVYSNLQRGARDAARRADVEAISRALEINYDSAAGTYRAVVGSDFAEGVVPDDAGAPYTGMPADGATTYSVCATLEDATTFCKANQQ